MTQEEKADIRSSGPRSIEEAVAYLEPIQRSADIGNYAKALGIVITAALERDAAVDDLERLLWIGGPCIYCAKDKGQGGHSKLDRPCIPCEPKWRGLKERNYTNERT